MFHIPKHLLLHQTKGIPFLSKYFGSNSIRCLRRLSGITRMASMAYNDPMAGDKKTLIAVAQMTSTSEKHENIRTIMDLLASASARGAKMVFLPEACDYVAENRTRSVEMAESMDGHFISECKRAARMYNIWLSVGGIHQKANIPVDDPERIFNTHVIIDNDGIVKATYNKTHLFDLDIPERVRLCESDFTLSGDRIHPPVTCPAGQLGMATCYDLRFPEIALTLINQGADMIAYPSAFTQVTGMAHWESLLRARAIESQCYVIAAAQTGKHNDKRTSYGHAMIVDPWGTIIAHCSEGTGLCLAEIDLARVKKVRSDMPVMLHRRTDLYGVLDGGAGTSKPNTSQISSSQLLSNTPQSQWMMEPNSQQEGWKASTDPAKEWEREMNIRQAAMPPPVTNRQGEMKPAMANRQSEVQFGMSNRQEVQPAISNSQVEAQSAMNKVEPKPSIHPEELAKEVQHLVDFAGLHLVDFSGLDRNCLLCKNNGNRKRSSYYCTGCPTKPALCIKGCFKAFHIQYYASRAAQTTFY